MSKEEILRNNYQPTDEDMELLEKHGVSLLELLSYAQPTDEELEHVEEVGFSMVQIMLIQNLHTELVADLAQSGALVVLQEFDKLTDEMCVAEQERLIDKTTDNLSSNRYPGPEFSVEQGEVFLNTLKSQSWAIDTLTESRAALYDVLQPEAGGQESAED